MSLDAGTKLGPYEINGHIGAGLPPVVIGGALIIPVGLLRRVGGARPIKLPEIVQDTERSEALAMEAVLEAERRLGYQPRDVSALNMGYDIESVVPETARLRFIEVKGRVDGADAVTITRNEILTALNKPKDFHPCPWIGEWRTGDVALCETAVFAQTRFRRD